MRIKLRKRILFFINLTVVVLLILSLSGCIVNDPEILEFAEQSTENYLIAINNLDYDTYRKDFDDIMLSSIPEEEFIRFSTYLKDTIGDYTPGSKQFSYSSNQKGLYLIFYTADYSFEKDVTIQMIFVEEGDYYKIGGSWFDSEKIQENVYE